VYASGGYTELRDGSDAARSADKSRNMLASR
jgi:hypothetical protein